MKEVALFMLTVITRICVSAHVYACVSMWIYAGECGWQPLMPLRCCAVQLPLISFCNL